ncbi:hypothetical protein Tco_1382631 [Tanacetum coccineum]
MHRYVKITPDVTSENLDTNNGDSDSSNDVSANDISVDNMETDNIDHNDDVEVNEVDDVNANVSANEHDHDDHVEDRDASVNVDHGSKSAENDQNRSKTNEIGSNWSKSESEHLLYRAPAGLDVLVLLSVLAKAS